MRFQTPAPERGPEAPRPASRRDPRALRRKVCVRSAALCALLAGGVALLDHADFVLGGLGSLYARASGRVEHQPLDRLVERVEAEGTAGRHVEVARLCAAILAQYPDHPVAEPAAMRLVQAQMLAGDPAGVVAALRDFRARFPESRHLPEALLDVAGWMYEGGSYLQAAHTYTDLVAQVTSETPPAAGEDTAPAPVIWRSMSLWKAHRRAERSRTELERLARFNQALAYERATEREAALRAFDRFLARFPQDARVPEARFHMATLLLDVHRVQEALDDFRAVYADSTAPPRLRCESVYRAGRGLEALRQFDAAIGTYERALGLRPADGEFRVASLAQLAQLLEEREPHRAAHVYRELTECSGQAAVRAAALERLAVLERDSAVAAGR